MRRQVCVLILEVLELGREAPLDVQRQRVVRDREEPVALEALRVQALHVHERVLAEDRVELRQQHEVAPGLGGRVREGAHDPGSRARG